MTATVTPPQAAPIGVSPEPGKIAIRDQDGSVWKIPLDQLERAKGEGARPATEAEWVSHQEGAAGASMSAAIGAARGLSLGFSDDLYIEGARALGGNESADRTRHVLNLAKEMHPDATLGGEVAGMTAPMFFGGGAITAARAGESLALRAARAAPRAFAEGAVIGAGGQSSEDALGNHKAVAENYLTSMGKGGAVGVILGTALHAGAGALKPADRFGAGVSPNAISQAEHAAMSVESAAAKRVEDTVNARFAPMMDPNAGLASEMGAIEKPFVIDPAKKYRVGLDTNALEGEFASVPGSREPISKIRVAQEAGEFGVPEAGKPFAAERRLEAQPQRAFARQEEPFDVFGPNDGFAEPTNVPKWIPTAEAPIEARFGLRDRGLAGLSEEVGERSVIGRSAGRTAPRPVSFGDLGNAVEVGAVPISLEEVAAKAAVDANRDANSTLGRFGASVQPEMTTMERLAYEQAYAATGARPVDIRRLAGDATAQDAARARIGKTLTENVPTGPTMSIGDYSTAIAEKAREVGKSFRPMYAELDKAAARPSLRNVAKAFDEEVRSVVSKGLYGEEQLAQAEHALEQFSKQGGTDPSFTKLYDLRRDLDKKLETHFARVAGAPAPPGEEAMRSLRDIVQNELMTAAQRASTELGKPIAERLSLANTLYRDLAAARSAASKEAARVAGAPAYSASDMMSVVAAVASGSPLGMAIPAANIIRKKFGNQIAAYALRKAAGLENLATASSRIDAKLDAGAKAVIEAKSSGTRTFKAVTDDKIREIRAASSNPDAVQKRISDAIHGMSEYAPKTAAELAIAAARVASYLALNLPKDQLPMGPIFTGKQASRQFSDTERHKASAMIEVAEDPSVVLDRMQEGLLMSDHVKALKAMHPESFYRIQGFLTSHAAELRPEMTIQQQITLSVLFQKPIAKVMERSNINALQASFIGGDQAAPNGMAPTVPKMAAGPVKGGGIRATAFDVAEKGGRK